MNLDPTGTHPDSYTDSHNAYTSAVGSRFACANARRFESGDAALAMTEQCCHQPMKMEIGCERGRKS